MIVPGSASPLLTTTDGGYTISKSLRFRSSASAYLSRTPGTSGNKQKWTFSAWIKRGVIGSPVGGLFGTIGASNTGIQLAFGLNSVPDSLSYTINGVANTSTTAVFRDPSAWYHIVFAFDSTQANAANRLIGYVNNVSYTFSSNIVVQNNNYDINNTVAHYIGTQGTTTNPFDGYMTDINFIDGQQLTPSSFGETDSLTSVWKPKQFSGTYGTNGFYLKFTDVATTSGSNAGLGKDFSGNGNYWTTNNISVTSGATYDSMKDVPTLTDANTANYAVLNPIDKAGSGTLVDGNLKYTTSSATFDPIRATIAVSSGKWYWEVNCISQSGTSTNQFLFGIASPSSVLSSTWYVGKEATGYAYYGTNGQKYNNDIGSSYGASFTSGDLIGVALDLDAGTLTFYKNNTSQGTAFTGISGTFSPAYSDGGTSGDTTVSINFGQQPFTYTPPTGYKALNTYNLPDSTIVAGNKYMDATTYTGNASSPRSITNAGGFKPDFVWIKNRSTTNWNNLFDSVRGSGKTLYSNATTAEASNSSTGYLSAFNSDGFAVTTGSSDASDVNANTNSYVGWQWQAGQGSTSSNTSGSITSTVSVNASAGFSIVTYTGTGANATVGHGLGVAPKFIIVKERSAANDWRTYHASVGNTGGVVLNLSVSFVTDSSYWNNTSPTSSVFSIGTNTGTNASGQTFVAYCWSEIDGFSKFGSYTGNNSTDGPFIYTGFRPKFILFKSSNNAAGWMIADSSRSPYNVSAAALFPSSSNSEYTVASDVAIDFLSNGIKIRGQGGETNYYSGGTYIYIAFAENPFKNSLAR